MKQTLALQHPEDKSIGADLVREALEMLKTDRESDMRGYFRDDPEVVQCCREDLDVINRMLTELGER